MVEMDIFYEGDLHCRLKHGPSGMEIATDAPKDNMGKGAAFSPTDLVASALASCILTTMGIYAQRHNLALTDMSAHVTKEMTAEPPRRIARLSVTVKMPAGIEKLKREVLERVGHTCPVHRSLHPEIEAPVKFVYPD